MTSKAYPLDVVRGEQKNILQRTDKILHTLSGCLERCPSDCAYQEDCECEYISQTLLEECHDLFAKYKAKQTPMLVNVTHMFPTNKYGFELKGGKCPACDEEISDSTATFYCKYCGQAVKWDA